MFSLPDKITYWKNNGSDGLGGTNWGTPVTVDSRNARKQEKFTDSSGNDAISSSVTYTYADVAELDFVQLGVSAEVVPPSTAYMVAAVSQTPSGAGDLKKLWL